MAKYINDLKDTNIAIGNYYTKNEIYTNIYFSNDPTFSTLTYPNIKPIISLSTTDSTQNKTYLNITFHLLKTLNPILNFDFTKNFFLKENPSSNINTDKQNLLKAIKIIPSIIINNATIFADSETNKNFASESAKIKTPNDIKDFVKTAKAYIDLLNFWIGFIKREMEVPNSKLSIEDFKTKIDEIIKCFKLPASTGAIAEPKTETIAENKTPGAAETGTGAKTSPTEEEANPEAKS
jgi:hypothetical protein